jgi:hypothetical protein
MVTLSARSAGPVRRIARPGREHRRCACSLSASADARVPSAPGCQSENRGTSRCQARREPAGQVPVFSAQARTTASTEYSDAPCQRQAACSALIGGRSTASAAGGPRRGKEKDRYWEVVPGEVTVRARAPLPRDRTGRLILGVSPRAGRVEAEAQTIHDTSRYRFHQHIARRSGASNAGTAGGRFQGDRQIPLGRGSRRRTWTGRCRSRSRHRAAPP